MTKVSFHGYGRSVDLSEEDLRRMGIIRPDGTWDQRREAQLLHEWLKVEPQTSPEAPEEDYNDPAYD